MRIAGQCPFEVRFNNGHVAEVSWASVRELPPKK
jgi:hypothetical protein